MPSEGAGQQDHAQKSNQAPPTKKPPAYQGDGAESTLCRPPTLHKQPPALPPKPFSRLPNHITGTSLVHAHHECQMTRARPEHPASPCRRRPGEAAVHVDEIITSSTSKEASDLRTCREHGALRAHLPEVLRPSQPRSDGRALPAVRVAVRSSSPAQPDHRGAQQDPGPHHAEV